MSDGGIGEDIYYLHEITDKGRASRRRARYSRECQSVSFAARAEMHDKVSGGGHPIVDRRTICPGPACHRAVLQGSVS